MMHYDVRGNADGPTLMLMHGFMSSNAQWDLNVEQLGERLQLVMVELMGHGSSPAPDDPDAYGRAAVLARLDEIRRDVGVDRWWVGGHSMGGAASIRYALANPGRVSGIVFTNTRAAFGTAEGRQDAVDHVRSAGGDVRSLRFHPIHAKHFPADVKAKMVAIADRMPHHALINTVSSRTSWASADEMHKLHMPVMLINGRFERNFQSCVPVVTAAVPHLELVELDGGHSVNVEVPARFNAAVLDFITRHDPA